MDSGQLSISLIEAGFGVVFILSVTMGFALGVPSPETDASQLDIYAEDTATVLANEPPRHGGETRLDEVTGQNVTDREYDALETRVDRIIDDNLMYRIELPSGVVGYERPMGRPTGQTTVPTDSGEVTIWLWYV